MTPEELQQCLEEAFGDLYPPYFEESFLGARTEAALENAIRTDTARTRRWQELRPLRQYLNGAVAIWQLTPKACQYYLPAYLYAMTDPENVWVYLGPVLDMLWYEDEDGDPLHNNADLRDKWEALARLLTDRQKKCIAHFLVEVLNSTKDPSVRESVEVHGEADRIEHMLKKYWNTWL
jgi:hypothetical protein